VRRTVVDLTCRKFRRAHSHIKLLFILTLGEQFEINRARARHFLLPVSTCLPNYVPRPFVLGRRVGASSCDFQAFPAVLSLIPGASTAAAEPNTFVASILKRRVGLRNNCVRFYLLITIGKIAATIN